MSKSIRTSLVFLFLVLILVPAVGLAQMTSGSVRGTVVTPAGEPAAGATVTITDTRTNVARSELTNARGEFNIGGLAIGGPFEVNVVTQDYKSALVTDVYTNLSAAVTLTIPLESGAMEEVVVTGSTVVSGAEMAIGPSANFNLEVLQTAPAVNRNLTDIIRADPRIYVDESRGDINAIQCGGKSPRYNSLTVDGVRMNDSFGLNDNGYPTERMPFSYDAINEVAVELAPFDVIYGGFSACNINAVTKSGGNEFYGGGFFDYTNDDMRGDSLEGDKIVSGSYSEKRYGVTFGGPIIKDRLFFFAAYEKHEGANLFDRGPLGSGAVNEINVTQAELDEIAEIARTIYQYDPGPIPLSLDNEDEKLLVKLDWNISDNHRLAFTYNWNDGNNYTESDGETYEFEFQNHLYERGAELTSYVGSLFSDWTDSFSTELRISYLELDNRQIPYGGTEFGEIRVETANVDVYLGADDSRQANDLDYDVTSISLKGRYDLNGHYLTFGVEREALDIFNMFVQESQTEIRFRGIDNFRNGYASAIYYKNAPSHIVEEAAAKWGYELNTVYGQDEFMIGDRLTIVAGLRYDWYTTSDEPGENPDFVASYGFSNAETVDGKGLLQPRLGFTYDISGATTLRGGIGLYSGGNPNVWISNSFNNNNILQFQQRGRNFGYTDGSRSLFDDDVVYVGCEQGVPSGPGWCVQEELYDAVSAGDGGNFEMNHVDPDFDLPSEWKFALGMTHVLPDDYVLTADLLLTQSHDAPMILRSDLEQTGTTEEGYPTYSSVREPSFALTNSDRKALSKLLSLGIAKDYMNGFSFTAGYAYSDAEDAQPMNSAVAFSNYTQRAFFDPQEDVLSTSNYNIRHRFTFTTKWRIDFTDNIDSVITLFGSANEGRPYSLAFDGTADPYRFTPFLDELPNVMEPGQKRNRYEGSWWSKLDLRVDVGFPLFGQDNRASAFLLIDNLTNLINDSWGVLNQYPFPQHVTEGVEEPRVGDASRYEVRVGVRVDF